MTKRKGKERGTATYGRSLYGTGATGKRPVCFIGLGGREMNETRNIIVGLEIGKKPVPDLLL